MHSVAPALPGVLSNWLTLPNLEKEAVFRVHCPSVSHYEEGSLLGSKCLSSRCRTSGLCCWVRLPDGAEDFPRQDICRFLGFPSPFACTCCSCWAFPPAFVCVAIAFESLTLSSFAFHFATGRSINHLHNDVLPALRCSFLKCDDGAECSAVCFVVAQKKV